MDRSEPHGHTLKNDSQTILNFLIILLSIHVLTIIILSSVPPTSRDALIHHLQIPKLYLQHGGIFEIPDLIFSYYPMNLDLLYMGALYLGSDILPKYIHLLFGLGTALMIYHYLKKRLSGAYALLGALFFLSVPIIIKLSITVYVDLGLVFFSTASLLLLFHWIEKKYQFKYLFFSGICCGFAMSTKYNGLLILFLLTFFIPILVIRSSKQTKKASKFALQAGILFFIFTILTASPWLIRNILWTSNPVYPLYNSVFNPSIITKNTTEKTSKGSIRGVFATRHVLYGENIGQLLLLPVRIFFEGQDDDPKYFDGKLNPFLLLLPFFAFFRGSQTNKQIQIEKKTFLAFCGLYFLFAFNTGVLRIRYLVPMVPFLVILSMYGLHNITILTKKHLPTKNVAHFVVLLPVLFMLGWNAVYMHQQFKLINPVSYISGQLSRDAYLNEYLPEYEVMKYANTHLPNSAKILCIFMGWRGYYLDREHVFDYHSQPDLLLSWLTEPDITVDTVLKRLQKNSLSHILLRDDLTTQWITHLSTKQQTVWNQLSQKNLSVLASHSGYSLLQILPMAKENLLSVEESD